MLTLEFLKVAAETKKEWADENWHPSKNWNWGLYGTYLHLEPQTTHCGTNAISNLHVKNATFKNLVRQICYQAVRGNRGHTLYFQPHMGAYAKAAKKFEKCGAEKLFEFHHLGYLNRKPDHGKTTVWFLKITPEELKELKQL